MLLYYCLFFGVTGVMVLQVSIHAGFKAIFTAHRHLTVCYGCYEFMLFSHKSAVLRHPMGDFVQWVQAVKVCQSLAFLSLWRRWPGA
jgi:hypothetical protein